MSSATELQSLCREEWASMNAPELLDDDRRAALLRIARCLDNPPPTQSEEERDAHIEEWDRLCPHPGGTNILFWPNELGLCRWDEVGAFQMSAQQMVDYAMDWEPRVVAMQVKQRSGGPSVGYYLYKLVAPNTPDTQVVTGLDIAYENGATLAVALKGVRLKDGSRVERVFDYGAMSCGRILGITMEEVGTRISGHTDDA